ncbi:MAG TPA: heme exporter protein CcmD [Xanthomonadaceae bacterium]|jgi:hypothetical protein|nr:heme exporter protein CcmD [Xanthomonadaceae bacterium]
MLRKFITLLVLAAMAGLLIWQYRAQYAALQKHQQREQAASAVQVSESQLQCNQKALERFRRLGLEGDATASHKGHFNTALNQCYMLIENSESSLDTNWKHITLYDGDGKVFASYGWHSENGEQDADIPAYTCDVALPSGEHQTCKTEEDFRKLVDAYMQ